MPPIFGFEVQARPFGEFLLCPAPHLTKVAEHLPKRGLRAREHRRPDYHGLSATPEARRVSRMPAEEGGYGAVILGLAC